jgi:hypothetical protein
MKMRNLRLTLVSIGLFVILPAATALVVPAMRAATSDIDSARIAAVAQQHPNFTVEQRLAIAREIQSELHPLWKNLSWSARLARASMFAMRFMRAQTQGASTSSQSPADFLGNLTVITGPSGEAIALQRQSNCSLSLYTGTYTFSLNPTIQIMGTTANYEQQLHNLAGLSTKADVFANGCAEATLGIGWRQAVYLGETTQNLYMGASAGYDTMVGSNVLYYGTIDPTTQAVHSFNTDSSDPGIAGVAAGDLNGDGLADIVGIDSTAASITVWLAKADGTVGTPTSYALPGNTTEAAVLADMNGDGKVDVVVATRSSSNQEEISVLTGNGDGTLNAPQSFPVPTPSPPASGGTTQIGNLIAADLRGTGHLDIVGSNGLVLLNSGTGTFTVGTWAFTPELGTSDLAPNLVAADFNNDGKIDLAVGTGEAVNIYLGNGDGTFTAGKSYSSINDNGYLTATDLDGDGNIDLYVGLANGGFFGSDASGASQAYALMGNGDGSFQGAPRLPFVYTGNNLADLNGDKITDAVGENSDLSFTSYLGDAKGGFSAESTLVTSPITVSGTQYTLSNIDSYAIGDVNGDGIPDLAYIGPTLNGIPNGSGGTGVFIALGNGQGGFSAPTFYAVPAVPSSISGPYTIYPTISNLHLADVNHDGKADLIYNYMYSYSASGSTNVNAGTAVQLGNGDGTFQTPQLIPFYSGPNLLSGSSYGIPYASYVTLITDLNKDGNPDLIFITQSATIDQTLSTYAASIQVALGKGDGTFSTPTTVAGPDLMVQSFTDAIPASIAVGDMNGDGVPDIIALGSSTSYNMQVAVALGNGDGTFKAPILKTYSAQYLNNAQGVAVADFNGDGNLDVAITDPYTQTASGISLGNGDGTLQSSGGTSATVPNLAINLQVGGATVALDLNGDGLPDLVSGNVELLSQPSSSTSSPNFSLTASSSSGTVTAGQSVQTTLTLTPSNGFDQSVSLSCSGLPQGAACGFSPASVTVNGTASTSTLTITTTAQTALNSHGSPLNPLLPGGLLLAGMGLPMAWRRRQTMACAGQYGLFALLLMGTLALPGCGGGGSGSTAGSGSSGAASSSGGSSSSGSSSGGSVGTPAGTSTVTITATAGSTIQTTTYTLTVS